MSFHFHIAVAVALTAVVSAFARADSSCIQRDDRFLGSNARLVVALANDDHLPLCMDSSVDLRNAYPGFKCLSSKGAVFERVERRGRDVEAWKGPDGKVWQDNIGPYRYADAVGACDYYGNARLPSRAEFERAEAFGIRDVVPGFRSKVYWTITTERGHSDRAYGYSGPQSRAFEMDRDDGASLLCVLTGPSQ